MRDLGKRTLFVALALVLSTAVASADFVEGGSGYIIFADPAFGGQFGSPTDPDFDSQQYTIVRAWEFGPLVETTAGPAPVPFPDGVLPTAGTLSLTDGFPASGAFFGAAAPAVGSQFIIAGLIQHDGGQLSMITGNPDDANPVAADDIMENAFKAGFNTFAGNTPGPVNTRSAEDVWLDLFMGDDGNTASFLGLGADTIANIGMVDDTTFGYTPGTLVGNPVTMDINLNPFFGGAFVGNSSWTNANGNTKDNFSGTLPPPGAPPIPEPASLLLFAVGAGFALRRKRAA